MTSSCRQAVSTGKIVGVLNRSWTYRYASSATNRMGSCRTVDVERGRGLLEQGARSRLCTNDRTGKQDGDGNWSKCNALKRHRVCFLRWDERKRWWLRLYGGVSTLPYGARREADLGAARFVWVGVGVAGKNQVETREMMERGGRQAAGGSRRVQGMQVPRRAC